MKHLLKIGLFLVFGLSAFAGPSVHAGGYDNRRGLKDDAGERHERYTVTTAHGCYFYRGRRFCSRYCYTEYNGYRYCQPTLRDAYPQADVWVEEIYPRRRHW